MKRKLCTALLAGMMVISMTACGGKTDSTKSADNTTVPVVTDNISHSEYSGYEDVEDRSGAEVEDIGDITYNGLVEAPGELETLDVESTLESSGDEKSADATSSNVVPDDLDRETTEESTDKEVSDDVKLERDKIIYTCDMSISVEDFDDAINTVEALVNDNEGIIEQSSYTDCSDSSGYLRKYKEYKIRIPSDNFDSFISEAGKNAEVLDKSTDAVNVTQDYNDYAATLEVYEAKYERYKALLNKATKMEDILTIEESLAGTQDDINWIKTRMNEINTDVAYSYVYLTVEDIDESKSGDPTFGDKVSNVFKNSWSGFLFEVIAVFPYILLLGAVIIAIVLTRRKIKKVEKKRKEEEEWNGSDSSDR